MSGALEGHVDGYAAGRLSGWARRAGDPVIVQARVDGRLVAEGPANLPRGDLDDAGIGACAFELLFDLAEGASVEVTSDEGPLPGSPISAAPSRVAVLKTAFNLPLGGGGVKGLLEHIGPERLRGWAYRPGDGPLALELAENGRTVLTMVADAWRNDLEDERDGDGSCGFDVALPPTLASGAVRRLDLRLAEGESLLAEPVLVDLARIEPEPIPPSTPPRPAKAQPDLSIIVVFYNMRREAERTLHSLSRAYQDGIEDVDYEVLVIDNGSVQPVDEGMVSPFGCEFRLFQPSKILPSPCRAINEAARAARGRRLAVMIDGAHVLSPGAMREALAAMDEAPGSIVALRQWFVGGDQRWLSAAGWSRAHEDRLFRKIDWPSDGYRLFQISSPMFESPNHWVDGMNESNCLFLEKVLFERIGGMDEAFSVPGAGFANLDLFRRAADGATGRIFALVGEASFHQFHGGTTTNVSDAEKDALVAGYAKSYAELRGGEFVGVGTERLHVRGTITTDQALTARQHLTFPGTLGVTDRVRPCALEDAFEEDAQAFARTAYIESGQHRRVLWAGEAVDLAPADLLNIQEIMRRGRPDLVVVTDPRPGLAAFLESARMALDLDARILRVAPSELVKARAETAGAGSVLVLFEPAAGDWLPHASLGGWGGLVTPGNWMVVLRTAIGQPWLGYSHNRSAMAARRLGKGPDFETDLSWQQQIITLCPFGYLRRRT